jgi:hypothetical protein
MAMYLKSQDSIPATVVVPSQGTSHGSKFGHPGSGSGSCTDWPANCGNERVSEEKGREVERGGERYVPC